ncbi:hypothetical protein OTERR_16620 [Oryzomicrobium terrae]|uniref:Uncharacterized protein n=1 Tax=Oryzomicrobium terrae TaxID=1735038 RepID=A0A5C1EA35_9RHOO|nr:hypothetical protein OTERR_16620 [Oryzomicrobium terrae]
MVAHDNQFTGPIFSFFAELLRCPPGHTQARQTPRNRPRLSDHSAQQGPCEQAGQRCYIGSQGAAAEDAIGHSNIDGVPDMHRQR